MVTRVCCASTTRVCARMEVRGGGGGGGEGSNRNFSVSALISPPVAPVGACLIWQYA